MSVTPFRINVPSEEIADLKTRILATRWPSVISGSAWAMGMDLGYLESLARYWVSEFDWAVVEADLNGLPQFLADTRYGKVHFVHFRGTGPSPLPIILSHGWPSTYAELVPLGRRLADPSSYGHPNAPSFDVIIPSLPGYAFSPAPSSLGTNVFTIAKTWRELMSILGYQRFIAHGGDIGAGVSTALALESAEAVAALHLNYIPGSYEPYLSPEDRLSSTEAAFLTQRQAWLEAEGGYAHVQGTKPDVLGVALDDSPMGLAAWIVDKYRSWSDCGGDVETRFSKTDLLTVVSIYWFTRSMPSAIRLYWEGRRRPLRFGKGERVQVPVAVANFAHELPIPPRSYVERGFNVVRWTDYAKGGHFAALEETDSLADDIRALCQSGVVT